jgi:Tc5 transposase DNA-binding domain
MPRERLARGHSDNRRKSYTLKFKHDVINEYQPGFMGKGFAAIAKKYGGLSSGAIRGWYKNREEIARVLQNRDIETRASRTLSGTGRSGKYQDVEEVVKEWILERNKKGLRVKDQYIRAKARRMYVELHMDYNAGAAESDKSADEDVSTLISAHQQAGVPGSNGAISL